VRRVAAGLAVAAALAAPGTARADELCVRVTVTDFATGAHVLMPPCVEVPLSLTYQERYVRFLPWIEVRVEFTPPSDSP